MAMNAKYMYIMDYSSGLIYEVKLTPENILKKENEGDASLLSDFGFNDSECSWMFTTQRIININKIKEK